MSIEGIDNTTPATSVIDNASMQAMGKDDFLLLMVTQLQNQDPLDPQDSTEFTAQLAQFSSLEQAINANETLKGIADSMAQQDRSAALSMIGNDVVVNNSSFQLPESGGLDGELGYRLSASAGTVTLAVLNASGVPVASLPVTDYSAGDHFLQWDGLDGSGQPLPAGNYSLAVMATDGNDQMIAVSPLMRSRVNGVDLSGNNNALMTGMGNYLMGDLSQISVPGGADDG